MVGANLPDVDVLAYLGGPAADLAFRRGWTHGILALSVWPFLLTGSMVLLDRLRRRAGRPTPGRVVPAQLLLLSAVSVLSHPLLDTLNTYGVRWLMPFSGRWFYGDTLFIVDPWLWLALGVGLLLSRRNPRPVRFALGFLVLYAGGMAWGGVIARRLVADELGTLPGMRAAGHLMLSPLPVTPFVRSVVAARGEDYLLGRFRWGAEPRLDLDALRSYPRGDPDHPAVAAARGTSVGRRFLGWARFPAFRVERVGGDAYLVHLLDLRYADRPGVRFGAVTIPITLPTSRR